MSSSIQHPSLSRRTFLARTSLTAAGLALGARRLSGSGITGVRDARRIPANMSPAMCFAAPRSPAVLQALATQAMDAATQAGATYADIRVGEYQAILMTDQFGTELSDGFGYGVRAYVDGGWAFVHGTAPTPDAVVAAARGAVAQARRNAAVVRTSASSVARRSSAPAAADFAQPPVVKGEWAVPVAIDPFAVPIQDQMALLVSWSATSHRHWSAYMFGMLMWRRETRVFAASTGSLVIQHLMGSRSERLVCASGRTGGYNDPQVMTPRTVPGSGGYELVADPAFYDEIMIAADQALSYAALPTGKMDVGRYPVVFDGATFGAALYPNLGQALELDRVLGEEADGAGTSLFAPPLELLGTVVTSPALTVTAGRALPDFTSVKWDDDGVQARTVPVITAGRLVDYQTSMRTVPALAPWYQREGRPVQSVGAAVAPEADQPVQVRCGHLTAAPASTTVSLDDLIRDISHGLLVRGGGYPATDQQLSSSSLGDTGMFFEVSRGRVVRRLFGNGLQWSTQPFWKALTAVGDASTVGSWNNEASKGQPWHSMVYTTSAPAGHFKAIDVISLR